MKNWKELEARYLRDDLPKRLGNLASNLLRIKTLTQKLISQNTVEYLMQESKYFIEWTGKEADIDTAAELVELQLQLARWQLRSHEIWENPAERAQLADRCGFWSERVLQLSGLL
jgi:hypothetical protein